MKVGDKIYCIQDWDRVIDEGEIKTDVIIEPPLIIKGKCYTIRLMFAGQISITDDYGAIRSFYTADTTYRNQFNQKFDEWFITEKQNRKKKLEDLADENFNQFLKKIKK